LRIAIDCVLLAVFGTQNYRWIRFSVSVIIQSHKNTKTKENDMRSSFKYLILSLLVFSVGGATYAQNKKDSYATGPFYLQVGPTDMGEILAWSWGASMPPSSGIGGGGGGASKVSFQELSIVRYTDKFSPQLLQSLAVGGTLPSVILSSGDVEIKLEMALITSYAPSGTSERNTALTEGITFAFAKVVYSVNGATACFDLSKGEVC